MIKIITLFVSIMLANMVHAQNFDMDYNPEMLIKYRKDFMTAIKGHNNAIKAIVYGAVPYTNHLTFHISSLQKMYDEIEHLFPQGSDFGETNAKASIWKNPEKFQKTNLEARQALTSFKQVFEQGNMDNTKAAFKTFGRASCGNCHKLFKKKQN